MKCVIAPDAYTSMDAIEKAQQPEALKAGEAVYASVYFIESPKGMQYTAQWFIDDAPVYTEKKAMETDVKGVIVYELPAECVTAGKLKVQVLYKDKPIFDRELTVA